ncbi:MAG TPA: preprotein translocase subunit SecE [Edaphocola sp.]|nr:preprotein translocase subunit SecE [Edaphocola sp.]
MGKFGTYVQEAYDELLHKVTWLSWSNLQSKTWITLIGLLVLTLIIFGMDAISEAVMNLIYSFA